MKNFIQNNSVKIKMIIALLAFGPSALVVNATLVPDKFDAGDVAVGRSLYDYPISSSPLLRESTPNQDSRVRSISTVSELIVISGAHEGMTVSGPVERTGIMDMPEHPGFLGGLQFNPRGDNRIEPTTTVSQLIGISDLHDGITVSQIVERAAITVPEPSTFLAGALLLLPLGAGTVRILLSNKIMQPKA